MVPGGANFGQQLVLDVREEALQAHGKNLRRWGSEVIDTELNSPWWQAIHGPPIRTTEREEHPSPIGPEDDDGVVEGGPDDPRGQRATKPGDGLLRRMHEKSDADVREAEGSDTAVEEREVEGDGGDDVEVRLSELPPVSTELRSGGYPKRDSNSARWRARCSRRREIQASTHSSVRAAAPDEAEDTLPPLSLTLAPLSRTLAPRSGHPTPHTSARTQ